MHPFRNLPTTILMAGLGASLALCAACGGGGGGAVVAAPQPVNATLPSEAARDGWAAPGNNFVSSAGSGVIAGCGDHVMGGQSRRQFFSFDISAIPAGSTVQVATLRLYQAAVNGTPYATHGNVIIDHLDYGTLDGTDYGLTALTAAAATLSTDTSLAYKTADVAALVQADITAGRSRSQFRVRWSIQDNDNDPTDDQARFVDAEDLLATGNPPELVLTFVAP